MPEGLETAGSANSSGDPLCWSPRRSVAEPHAPAREQELLDTVWEGLNIARDNKALVIVKQGTIININQISSRAVRLLFG